MSCIMWGCVKPFGSPATGPAPVTYRVEYLFKRLHASWRNPNHAHCIFAADFTNYKATSQNKSVQLHWSKWCLISCHNMKNLNPLSQAPIYFPGFPHYSPKSPLDFHLRLMALNRRLCIFSAVFWTFSCISLILLFIRVLSRVHLVFSLFSQCLKGIIKPRANQQTNRLTEAMARG